MAQQGLDTPRLLHRRLGRLAAAAVLRLPLGLLGLLGPLRARCARQRGPQRGLALAVGCMLQNGCTS